MRRSEIPAGVLQALNGGREETITLMEWLAVDMPVLLRNILPQVGLGGAIEALGRAADQLDGLGVTRRLKGIGAALFEATRDHPQRWEIHGRLAEHPSDMVRAWAAFALAADPDIPLAERLEATRRFAADRCVSVRECAWDSYRPTGAVGARRGPEYPEVRGGGHATSWRLD